MFRLQRMGGEKVGKGTYWNVSDGERVRMDRPGRLPGDATQGYLRFHPLALLVVGPLMGLIYAIFMPLVAILMVLWVLGGRILGAFAGSLGRITGPGWNRMATRKAAVAASSPASTGGARGEAVRRTAPRETDESAAGGSEASREG